MTQPSPLAPDLTRPDPPPVPARTEAVWSQLPAERQQQTLVMLAQMLLKALAPEVSHDPPE